MKGRVLAFSRRALDYVARAFLAASCICLAGIVILLTYSSVRRYVAGTPLSFTEELAALLFLAAAFLSLLPGYLGGQQVRLELLHTRLPRRWRTTFGVVGQIATLLLLGTVGWQTWGFAHFSLELGARSEDAELLLWPWMAVIPLSLVMLAAAVALGIVSSPGLHPTGRKDPPGSA